MAKATKPGKRYPSGRLKAPSAEDRAKLLHREADATMAVVRAQPHRRWSKDPDDKRLESAVGRFAVLYGMDDAIINAAKYYGDLVMKWRKARNVPIDLNMLSEGAGDQPRASDVDGWQEEIERIELAVARDSMGLQVMKNAILDEQDAPEYCHSVMHDALVALAKATRHLDRHHPFVRGI